MDTPAPAQKQNWVPMFFLLPSILLERLAYYGLRGILLVGILGENTDHYEFGYKILASFTLVITGAPIIGGIVIDLFQDKRFGMIAGSSLMAIGAIILAIPGINAFFGLSILAAGSGFFRPAYLAYLGSVWPQGPKFVENAYLTNQVFVNIGALVGVGIFSTIQGVFGFSVANLIGAIVLIGATVLLIVGVLTSSLPQGQTTPGTKPIRLKWPSLPFPLILILPILLFLFMASSEGLEPLARVFAYGMIGLSIIGGLVLMLIRATPGQILGTLFIFLFSIGVILFWVGNEFSQTGLFTLFYPDSSESYPGFDIYDTYKSLIAGVTTFLTILLLIIANTSIPNLNTPLWRALKIGIGVLLTLLGTLLLLAFPDNTPVSIALLYIVIFTLGEATITSLMHALIWKNAPVNARATAFGLYTATFSYITLISSTILSGEIADFTTEDYYIGGILFSIPITIIAATWIVIKFLVNDKETQDSPAP